MIEKNPARSVDYPDSYYAASANTAPEHAFLGEERRADVCVIGGGLTGVCAALHLAERGFDVVLLEAQRIGFGASGRNGGQVGSGLREDVLDLERSLGRDHSRMLWNLAEEAKAIIAERMALHAIECDYKPGNLLAVTKARYIARLEAEAEHLALHYDYDSYRMLGKEEMRSAVASDAYCAGRLDTGGGHLHPLNYLLGLADAARDAGACVYERSPVTKIDWRSPALVRSARGSVRADHVLVCTNAYVDALVPGLSERMLPIVNHVAATAPLGEARARGLIANDVCVHSTKFVVDYYRCSADNRLLFGGGETYRLQELGDVKGFVRKYMLRVFPQLRDVDIDFAWSGRVAITMSRLPDFGRLHDNGYYAQGFSGHGVALSQLAGRLLAEAVAGDAERFDVFSVLAHRSFPGGRWLRHPLLVIGMLYYALRDRL